MKFTKQQIEKVIRLLKGIDLAFIDLFCGAGGTTTGIKQAGAKVFLCINHDPMAIASHSENDDSIHLVEDVRTANITEIARLCSIIRTAYPEIKICLWASAECTNFSKAKGGLPRDADSRTLAMCLINYIDEIHFNTVYIENVTEFMCWGPLDENGKPVSRYQGRDFLTWINMVKQCRNYRYEHKILNAADYGAYTSRVRYFGQFVDDSMEMAWPNPTHAKKPEPEGMFGFLKKWKPVKDVLNFEDEGESIFTRRKQLSEKTLERIYAGLVKFIAGGKKAFMMKYNSTNQHSGVSTGAGIDDPCHTLTTQDRLRLINCAFITRYYSGGSQLGSVEDPAGTVTTVNKQHVVKCAFISKYYGNGDNVDSIDDPAGTVTTKDRLYAVQAKYFIEYSCGSSRGNSIDDPAGTVTVNPKNNLVAVKPFILATHFNNIGHSIEEPAPTITAGRKRNYLMNPQYFNAGGSIQDPCFTLIARMDKMPPYLVTTKQGSIGILILKNDTPAMVKIKEFMALYGIMDITMRGLRIPELLLIQGFPKGYILKGNQTQQKKFIGNSVEVGQAKAIIAASIEKNGRFIHQKVA